MNWAYWRKLVESMSVSETSESWLLPVIGTSMQDGHRSAAVRKANNPVLRFFMVHISSSYGGRSQPAALERGAVPRIAEPKTSRKMFGAWTAPFRMADGKIYFSP
jgi:hypothetical protein